MARKASADSGSARGFDDIIGVALLAAAVLLVVAQLSFDHNDISFLTTRLNKPTRNWIGPIGAYLAWFSFVPFGAAGYLLPELSLVFGLAYLLGFPGHLRERARWSVGWSFLLIVSLTGLCYILGEAGWFGKLNQKIGSQSAGGWLGYATYGETRSYKYGFCLLAAWARPLCTRHCS